MLWACIRGRRSSTRPTFIDSQRLIIVTGQQSTYRVWRSNTLLSRLIFEITCTANYILLKVIAGGEQEGCRGEKENVAQNAKDILPDDSRGTIPVTFDFTHREKFSRLQTTNCCSMIIRKIIDTKKRSVYLWIIRIVSLIRAYPSRSHERLIIQRSREEKIETIA